MKVNTCINYLFNAMSNKVSKYYSEQLSGLDVTPAQCGVLLCLWEKGQITPKEIGSILHLEASSVSNTLDRMQKNDLITRENDPNCRRSVYVKLTDKGRALQEPIELVIEKAKQDFLNPFSDEEQAFLMKAFVTISELEVH